MSLSLSLLELKTMNSAYYKMSTSLSPSWSESRRLIVADLKIVLQLSATLLLMNAALIRGRRSLIFLLSYAVLNWGRRFIGGGAFSSKYGQRFCIFSCSWLVEKNLRALLFSFAASGFLMAGAKSPNVLTQTFCFSHETPNLHTPGAIFINCKYTYLMKKYESLCQRFPDLTIWHASHSAIQGEAPTPCIEFTMCLFILLHSSLLDKKNFSLSFDQ